MLTSIVVLPVLIRKALMRVSIFCSFLSFLFVQGKGREEVLSLSTISYTLVLSVSVKGGSVKTQWLLSFSSLFLFIQEREGKKCCFKSSCIHLFYRFIL